MAAGEQQLVRNRHIKAREQQMCCTTNKTEVWKGRLRIKLTELSISTAFDR